MSILDGLCGLRQIAQIHLRGFRSKPADASLLDAV
jgi:hypothetical protein